MWEWKESEFILYAVFLLSGRSSEMDFSIVNFLCAVLTVLIIFLVIMLFINLITVIVERRERRKECKEIDKQSRTDANDTKMPHSLKCEAMVEEYVKEKMKKPFNEQFIRHNEYDFSGNGLAEAHSSRCPRDSSPMREFESSTHENSPTFRSSPCVSANSDPARSVCATSIPSEETFTEAVWSRRCETPALVKR